MSQNTIFNDLRDRMLTVQHDRTDIPEDMIGEIMGYALPDIPVSFTRFSRLAKSNYIREIYARIPPVYNSEGFQVPIGITRLQSFLGSMYRQYKMWIKHQRVENLRKHENDVVVDFLHDYFSS